MTKAANPIRLFLSAIAISLMAMGCSPAGKPEAKANLAGGSRLYDQIIKRKRHCEIAFGPYV